MKEALLYGKKDKKQVQCNLCAHRCIIADDRLGICAVRKNKDGILYSLSYGQLLSSNVDPIEKKPLFHFKPGHSSYSIATAGCNLKCDFCQNWQISQKAESDRLGVNPSFTAPEDIIKKAKDTGCRSIAYTYTEPTVFFEYALDVSRMARQGGIYNVFVTNGFMTKECLDMMDGLLDAANVDLKSFRDDYYRRLCAGSLKPVLESIERMKKIGVWVEVTTLIVPGMNDSPRELR
ncbi:MAG: AmmeMemoRadiSam system radical SAM enzyme, partial [Candidatus Omnitrophota bacterium]